MSQISISATPNSSTASVSLTVSSIDPSTNTISITRNNPDGSTSPVRGCTSVLTGGAGTMAFFDYEAPLDQPVSYTVATDQAVINSNPYFETDATGWRGTTAPIQSNTYAHQGNFSGKFHQLTIAPTPLVESVPVPVTPGAVYSASGWVLTSIAGTVQLVINWYDNTNTLISSPSLIMNMSPTTWASGSITSVTAPANAVTGSVGVSQVFNDTYIDEMKLLLTTFAATSAPVIVATDGQTYWLKNVSQESLSVKVSVSSMSGVGRKARVLANYPVLGRKNPVVISDVRAGRSGTMVLTTATIADMNALEAILAAGGPLFFQAPASTNFPDLYFSAGDVDETWAGVATSTVRLITIPFTEIDAPTDNLVSLSGNSWNAVALFGTWGNLKNKRTSWLDVLNRPYTPGDAA